MKAALIEGANRNLGAPEGWNRETQGDCGRLAVKIEAAGSDFQCTSAWKPSPQEMAVLNDGGYVVLTIAGWQVPVALSVVDRRGAQELG